MWDVAGVANDYMRPIFFAKIVYAAGPVAGQGPLNVLCIGKKISAGNLVANSEVRQAFSREDCNTAAGEGSQLGLMGIGALQADPSCNLFLIAVTESGTAATVTMLLATVPSTDGTITIRVNGKSISTSYVSGTAVDTIGAAIVTRFNAQPDCPFTAAYNSGTDTLTLTSKNLGAGEKDWIIYQDLSSSGGVTSTITGSAAVNTFGQISGVRAGASATGTGTEDYTTVLTKIVSKRYARIAIGASDTTNAPLVKAFMAAQAGPTTLILDMAVFATNNTQGTATTLAQTTLNDPRSQVFAHRNSETHPAIIAAGWAAKRAATEGADPVPDYDNFDCSAWVAPTQFDSDTWLPTEENALLNAGVTPIKTQDGVAKCVRAVCTYCLNGGVQDTRCLDIGDPVFMDYMVIDLQGFYSSQFRPGNKYVQKDPAENELEPKSGVAYPRLWKAAVLNRMQAVYFANNWIEDTFSGDNPTYPVDAIFNTQARRIQSNVPVVVRRVQHQLGVIARQTAPAA